MLIQNRCLNLAAEHSTTKRISIHFCSFSAKYCLSIFRPSFLKLIYDHLCQTPQLFTTKTRTFTKKGIQLKWNYIKKKLSSSSPGLVSLDVGTTRLLSSQIHLSESKPKKSRGITPFALAGSRVVTPAIQYDFLGRGICNYMTFGKKIVKRTTKKHRFSTNFRSIL